MTWTYSDDPSTDDKDQVRFLIGDTNPSDPQLTDEEILWLLSQHADQFAAAVAACDALAAKYAREVSKTVGDLSVQAESRSKHYIDLKKTIQSQRRSVTAVAGIYAGGSTRDPMFRLGQFDNPRAGVQTTEYGEEDEL